MKIDVQFVSFPKSPIIRSIVTSRVQDCIDKFSHSVSTVKVFFSMESFTHHTVKIVLHENHGKHVCVHASSGEVSHSIENVIHKLEAVMRKISTRRKGLRFNRPFRYGLLQDGDGELSSYSYRTGWLEDKKWKTI